MKLKLFPELVLDDDGTEVEERKRRRLEEGGRLGFDWGLIWNWRGKTWSRWL
jgi:hypothetical protein